MFGSHLSIAGSMVSALDEGEQLGLDTVQVFTKNQQQWQVKPLDSAMVRDWHARIAQLGWQGRTVSHASYLINLAAPADELWRKSIDLMRVELDAAKNWAFPFWSITPVRTPTSTLDEGLARIAAAYQQIFASTRGFKTISCLEGTAGAGSTIGGDFDHLARLRMLIGETTGEARRVGFCLDSCHLHAAGYDMSTRTSAMRVLEDFDTRCGIANLKVWHLNDSKGKVGSHLDRHAHIGEGEVGRGVDAATLADSGFAAIVNHPAFARVPKILETPKEEPSKSPGNATPWDRINVARLRTLQAGAAEPDVPGLRVALSLAAATKPAKSEPKALSKSRGDKAPTKPPSGKSSTPKAPAATPSAAARSLRERSASTIPPRQRGGRQTQTSSKEGPRPHHERNAPPTRPRPKRPAKTGRVARHQPPNQHAASHDNHEGPGSDWPMMTDALPPAPATNEHSRPRKTDLVQRMTSNHPQSDRSAAPSASAAATAGLRLCAVLALAAGTLSGGCYQTTGKAVKTAVVVEKTPEQIAADNLSRARALQNKGMNAQALLAFERAIENNPTMTQAYVGAAQIYQAQGNYAEAADRFGQAAEIEPRNFDAQYGYGLMLQLLDRVSESIRAYLKALSIKPNDYSTNLNLATAYFQIGEPTEALPYAKRAVQLNAKSSEARVNLGAIHGALEQHEQAVNEYLQALDLGPLQPPVLLNLAESYNKLKRYDEMVNTLQQLVRNGPSQVAYERLGSGLFRLKKYDDAEAAFRKSIELDGNHYPALNGIGVCLLNKYVWGGSVDDAMKKEAIGFLRRSLQIEGSQPRIVELCSRYK